MSAKHGAIQVPGAAAPQGPYSQAVRAGDFIYVSGQGSLDPKTNMMSFGTIEHETRMTLENIRRILEGCGASMANVVSCRVYLAHAGDFAAMNGVYAEYFTGAKPVRTTVQAVLVEPAMKIEIDCVAYLPRD